jgi:hypothetical protein
MVAIPNPRNTPVGDIFWWTSQQLSSGTKKSNSFRGSGEQTFAGLSEFENEELSARMKPAATQSYQCVK